MRYEVYENFGKSTEEGLPYSFATFAEALAHAKEWLGEYDNLPLYWDGSPYDYNGYGDMIEIRAKP